MHARLAVVVGHADERLVRRVEVPYLPPGLRIDHHAQKPRRHDDLLLPKPELGHEGIIADVDGVQRLQRVGIDRHAQRAVVVYVVGDRRPPVAEQTVLHRDLRLGLQARVQLLQLRRRAADAQDVLILPRVRPALHVGPVQLVRDHVGLAVPPVPLQPGIIPVLARPPADEHALVHPRVVPRQRHKLVGHAIPQPDHPRSFRRAVIISRCSFSLFPFPFSLRFRPHLHRRAAQREPLLDELLQLFSEGVPVQHIGDEALQRIGVRGDAVLVDLFVPAGGAHGDLALLAPYQARQLRAHGLCRVQPEQLPRLVRPRAHGHHGHHVPRLVQPAVKVLPHEDAVVVKLRKRRHVAQLEYILQLPGDARSARRPLHEPRPP